MALCQRGDNVVALAALHFRIRDHLGRLRNFAVGSLFEIALDWGLGSGAGRYIGLKGAETGANDRPLDDIFLAHGDCPANHIPSTSAVNVHLLPIQSD